MMDLSQLLRFAKALKDWLISATQRLRDHTHPRSAAEL
jgi:hypothetical protein